jgi:hypothetical protein
MPTKIILHLSLATGLLLAAVVSMSDPAEARRGGRFAAGLAIGAIVGLGIAGAYAGPRYYYGPRCYRGPRRCYRTGRSCWYNRWGEQVCGGGALRCRRATYCD